MNTASISPDWVTVLAALLTPVVAVFATIIALQQWRTAREKLKLDLFDRRLPVYEQTRDILSRRMALGSISSSEINDFGIKVRVSRWLFGSTIAEYLEEIVGRLQGLNSLELELETIADENDRKHNIGQQREIKNWLDDQRYKVIDARLGQYLHVGHEAPMITNLAISRGFFRLWVVVAIAWFCAVAFVIWPGVRIAWPWSASPVIHVKVSNTETWDYPPDWGVARIRDDLRRRMAEEDDHDRKWAAAVPSERKAVCDALSKSNTPFDKQPEDCNKLFWMGMGERAVPNDWESQFQNLPIPINQVGLMVAPWAFVPPMLLLITGLSLGWVIRGFRRI